MRLHLIIGPTAIGKTRLAVAVAVTSGCPVIALDRIQCHPEIAVGSGRPLTEELGGTQRVYLDTRPLSHGPISASTAVDQLVRTQQQMLDDGVTTLAMEGGSISMLHELAIRTDWREGWTVRVTVCEESSARRYEEKVASRVEQMLGYGADPAGPRTLLDDLAALWDDPLALKYASEVLGYREAIDLCERQGFSARELTGPHGRLWRYELSGRIRDGHLAYSCQQRAAIAAALPALHDFAEGVQWYRT
ncbi:isopentenyl transferase family protein [Streptomyces sp. NPDC058371]|uniref:isopentenyl transferase family protein n=1 Tax=Streptomyces sp. NPDC058371 TaxID=3346463 RepID=UPI0036630D0A